MNKISFNESRLRHELTNHLIISILMLAFPLCGGLMNSIQFFKLIIIFISSGIIGKWINNYIGTTDLFSLTQAALNIFIGLFAISVAYFFTGNFLPIYATTFLAFLLSIFIVFKEKYANYRKLSVLYYLPIVVLFFLGYDYLYSTNIRLSRTDGDYFYYTLLVESFSRNCNLQNPFFHLNASTNYYQFTTFIIPSFLKAFTGLASSVVLWGVFMKLLIFLSISLLCNFVFDTLESQTGSQLAPIFYTLAMVFFIFLGPLHLFNLIKLKLKDILFLGEGYWLPLGSPGYPFAVIFGSVLMMFLINQANSPFTPIKLITIFILSFIIFTSKIAFSLPFILFLTLFLYFNVEFRVFLKISITLFMAFLLSQQIALQADSIKLVSITDHGFYYKRFLDVDFKYQMSNTLNPLFCVLTGLIVHCFLWVGMKTILILPFLKQLKSRVYSQLYKSWLAVFIVFISVAFFVHMESEGNSTFPALDESFDFADTVRSSLIIFQTIFILFTLTRIILLSQKYKFLIALSLFGWSSLCFYSLMKNNCTIRIVDNNSWYTEVAREVNLIPVTNKLFAMQGNYNCSGQTLAPLTWANWYCTGWRSDGDGYVWSRTVLDRNTLIHKLISTAESKKSKKQILQKLKAANVRYLVGTGENVEKLKELKAAGLLTLQKSKHKWIFEII